MFQAQLLIVGTGGATTKIYSPWFPRQGDYLRGAAELIAEGGGATLTVKVKTKNSEDTTDGAAATGTDMSRSSAGIDTQEYSALKEMVRYEFQASGDAGDWVLFRMLNPVWFDAAKV